MLIDTDLLFDEMEGYGFFQMCEVKAVIDDKVKCEDGEVLEFYEDVEYVFDEFDEILILKKKQTLNELEDFKSYLIKKNNSDLITTVEGWIAQARKSGAYETFACIHDDTFYDLVSFSI